MLFLIKWLLFLIAVWIALGALMYHLDYAENTKDGMKFIAIKWYVFVCWLCSVAKNINDFFEGQETFSDVLIPDKESCKDLKDELKALNFFEFLLLSSINCDKDTVSIKFRYGGEKVKDNVDVAEIVFKTFLLEFYNYPLNTPIHIYVHADKRMLCFHYALTNKGVQKIEEQRNNREGRQIPPDDDLVE